MTNKFHFIGIGGIGMSALARLLLENKQLVSGSDIASNANTEGLVKLGAIVNQGHSAKYISREATVIYSSGIKETNPEFQAALALKCPMMHRSELLALLMKDYQTLAVTGTHGKTTTSSLLAHVLEDATFVLGGLVSGVNSRIGKSAYFVAEADESDGTFLNYHPEGAIITNIEPDHLDYFETFDRLQGDFKTFFSQVKNPDLLFYWGEDPVFKEFGRGVSYGMDETCDLRVTRWCQKGWGTIFELSFEGKTYSEISLSLPGEHNVLNAAAVFGLALRLGLDEAKIREGLKTFPGVARRCEKKREESGALFLDDYAHHPTEIKKTLKAVQDAIEERRLIVIFQPHRYTRTRDFFENFAKSFERADHVYITDIYSAGEEPISGITAEALIEKIREVSTVPCEKFKPFEVRPHDVVLTLGAGDITHFHDQSPSVKKYVVGLIFGGVTCEHEISLRSSRFVSGWLDRQFYDVRFFGIDKEGRWIAGGEAEEILKHQTVVKSDHGLSILDPGITQEMQECDLFVPILHGTYGEDGTIQGFFEMLGKPYIGPDHRSAAISMDKFICKKLVETKGIRTPKDLAFRHAEWLDDRKGLLSQISQTLTLPLYVKPIHLGSSVGIGYVESLDELESAVELAFRYDNEIMVEEGKVGCRELEFAVMGNDRIYVPPPGEKLAEGQFVSYEKKYSSVAISTNVNPDLDPVILKRGQELACKAYRAIGCKGMTRVDFLLDSQGEYWFFEMNPIPGLQQLSLFPKIWKREGVEPERLMDRLIILALQKQSVQNRHYNPLSN